MALDSGNERFPKAEYCPSAPSSLPQLDDELDDIRSSPIAWSEASTPWTSTPATLVVQAVDEVMEGETLLDLQSQDVFMFNGSSKQAGKPAIESGSERKVAFVERLTSTTSFVVETMFPLSARPNPRMLPLVTFIRETLRRSRSSYATLQLALYYLLLLKPHVRRNVHDMELNEEHGIHLQEGRRMFLASLILASKYLQDRNYSARAWSKISGLSTLEINQNEMAFLTAVNWNLHLTNNLYERWSEIILQLLLDEGDNFEARQEAAKWIILRLKSDLSNQSDIMGSFQRSTPSPSDGDTRPK